MHLQSTGLLTMLLSQRKEPPTNDKNNPSGFVIGHSVCMEYVDSVDDTDSITSSTKADHIQETLMFHVLQPRMIFVNDDNLDLFLHGPDHVTISLSQLQKMIVKQVLIIRMNLVGLMPSVILRVDALTPTHTVSQRLREDSSIM